MTAATRDQVRALKTKSVSELKAQYEDVFGSPKHVLIDEAASRLVYCH